MNLKDAIAKYVEDGDVISLGGFTTNRKPYAAVNEIIRQGQKDFIHKLLYCKFWLHKCIKKI